MCAVLPLDRVDKSIHPFQTHFGLVFCHEAVQTSLLFPERGSIGVLLLADSPISPQHGAALTSGFGASQAETGGKGQESTSRAVHRRLVLPAAIAGVRWRSRCANRLPPRSRVCMSATRSDA
jgi:hypothetical protein